MKLNERRTGTVRKRLVKEKSTGVLNFLNERKMMFVVAAAVMVALFYGARGAYAFGNKLFTKEGRQSLTSSINLKSKKQPDPTATPTTAPQNGESAIAQSATQAPTPSVSVTQPPKQAQAAVVEDKHGINPHTFEALKQRNGEVLGTTSVPTSKAPDPKKSIKMNKGGICLKPGDEAYDRNKNVIYFDTMEACIKSGGRKATN